MGGFLLPDHYSETLRTFEGQLAVFSEQLTLASPDEGTVESGSQPAHPLLAQAGQRLQQYFQTEVRGMNEAMLEAEMLPPEARSRFRSAHIEVQRLMRLLQTDLLFLGSAQQPETRTRRLVQIQERLTQLREYCKAMQGEGEGR